MARGMRCDQCGKFSPMSHTSSWITVTRTDGIEFIPLGHFSDPPSIYGTFCRQKCLIDKVLAVREYERELAGRS